MARIWSVVRLSTGLSAFTTKMRPSVAKVSMEGSNPASFISSYTEALGSPTMRRSASPAISARKELVVREKEMRSDTASSVSPRRAAATARPRGAVEVEPSSRGKFSRVKAKGAGSGSAVGSWVTVGDGVTSSVGGGDGGAEGDVQADRDAVMVSASRRAVSRFMGNTSFFLSIMIIDCYYSGKRRGNPLKMGTKRLQFDNK